MYKSSTILLLAILLFISVNKVNAYPSDFDYKDHIGYTTTQNKKQVQNKLNDLYQWMNRRYRLKIKDPLLLGVRKPLLVSLEEWPFKKRFDNRFVLAKAVVFSNSCRMSISNQVAFEMLNTNLNSHQSIRDGITVPIHEILHCVFPTASESFIDNYAAALTIDLIGFQVEHKHLRYYQN